MKTKNFLVSLMPFIVSLSFIMFFITGNSYNPAVIQSYATEGRLYNQYDTKWKNIKFNKYSNTANDMYTSGCGIFSFCNAIYALNDNTPDAVEIATWAVNNGSYQPGNGGTYRHPFYNAIESAYGERFNFKFEGDYYGKVTDARLVNHLKKGGVAVIHVYNHFMAISGYNPLNNTYLVIESAVSNTRGLQPYGWESASKMNSGNTAVDWYALLSNKEGVSITSGMELSYETIPSFLERGEDFSIQGNIESYLPIDSVQGGIYNEDWSVRQYAEDKPHSTSYSLAPYFDNHIDFSQLEEGTYNYLITATDSGGKEYTIINVEFAVGDFGITDLQATSKYITMSRSQGECGQIIFSYELYEGDITLSYEHGENCVTDCEFGQWSDKNSIPLIISGTRDGTEIITVQMKDTNTNEIIDTVYIMVKITSEPFEFTASRDYVTINNSESEKIVFGYKNYPGNTFLSFEHGENAITTLNWEGWNNNTNTLDIKGYKLGEETITVSLKDSDKGDILATVKIKIVVTDLKTELIASDSALEIDMDNDEIKSITFSYKNLPADSRGCSINYEHGEHKAVDLEWSEWNEHQITLYIQGYRTGTENLKIRLYDKTTGKLYDEKTIEIKVSGTPKIISSEDNISLNYNKPESKTVEFTMIKYPYDCSIFYIHGENPVTECKWNGWNGDTDILLITPTAPGTETIRIEMRTGENVIVSKEIEVTVTAEFNITFDANGGNVSVSEKTVTFGGKYKNLPSPVREGYIFDGWYTKKIAGTKITADTEVSITDNQTLYAHWKAQVIEGDCNNDGEFDVSDVVILQKWLVGNSNVNIKKWKNADLNEDDVLDVFDLVIMKRKLINN
ncbi:MAG: InlB B-repeat-containing protein [Ruminococcus sp.]|nr:InlB B-repeat-containing protein [Ruminococcus sp.]